jgi:hypothetical protein
MHFVLGVTSLLALQQFISNIWVADGRQKGWESSKTKKSRFKIARFDIKPG